MNREQLKKQLEDINQQIETTTDLLSTLQEHRRRLKDLIWETYHLCPKCWGEQRIDDHWCDVCGARGRIMNSDEHLSHDNRPEHWDRMQAQWCVTSSIRRFPGYGTDSAGPIVYRKIPRPDPIEIWRAC